MILCTMTGESSWSRSVAATVALFCPICKEILEAILERQLWTPTDCKTPEQTLYGSIFREIATKEHPRIVKSEIKGKFRIAD